MTGTTNAQQTINIVNNLETAQAIKGKPGAWTISSATTVPALLGAKLAMGVGVPAGQLSAGQVMLAQAAVEKSNAAAVSTPSAASGSPTTSSTAPEIIASIAKGISSIGNIPANVQQLEAGTTATLHWWGWEADLNESATQALLALLGTDVMALVSIASALAAVSAPLAAVAAIVGALSTGFDTWITDEDTAKKGVIIYGYLWVGIRVEGQ